MDPAAEDIIFTPSKIRCTPSGDDAAFSDYLGTQESTGKERKDYTHGAYGGFNVPLACMWSKQSLTRWATPTMSKCHMKMEHALSVCTNEA